MDAFRKPILRTFSENAPTTPPHELYEFPNVTLHQSDIAENIEARILVE